MGVLLPLERPNVRAHSVYLFPLWDGTGRVQVVGAVTHVTLRTARDDADARRIAAQQRWQVVPSPF